MTMTPDSRESFRSLLLQKKAELAQRVDRIHEHARDPLEADSSEQAAQLGNVAVVAALEAEAVAEIAEIDGALSRLDAGRYGVCVSCGDDINQARLQAYPASAECLDCAEQRPAR